MFYKYVNLKYVDEYLENEIKEISGRWAHFMINKLALERVLKDRVITKEEEEAYAEIEAALKGKKQQDKARVLLKFTDEDVKAYEKVKEHKTQEAALEEHDKGLKEFCEFLETATELQAKVKEQAKPITYAKN